MDAGSKSGMTNGRGLVGMNLLSIEGVEKLRAAKGKRCEGQREITNYGGWDFRDFLTCKKGYKKL